MDIAEFVSQSLEQIMRGVESARASAAKHGAVVNPVLSVGSNSDFELREGYLGRTRVRFDLSVVVTDTTAKEGKAGISIFGGGIGGSGSTGTERAQTTRIRFSVPIVLPHTPRE